MKQPALGKKIAELRLAKGLTQRELAEMCNVSLRTIQRIESADVTPRSYTLKVIFRCLDYEIYSSFGRVSYTVDRIAFKLRSWFTGLSEGFLKFFNLKENTMRKVSILSVSLAGIILLLVFAASNGRSLDKESIRAEIRKNNQQFVTWFNEGQTDSIVTFYHDDACLVPVNSGELHGREKIKVYYDELYSSGFRFLPDTSVYLMVSDSMVVDRGRWRAYSGLLSGTYLTHWKRYGDKWMIRNEMSHLDPAADQAE